LYYRVVLGHRKRHRNWQIETTVWNLAGFITVGLEIRWQRFGQFLDDLINYGYAICQNCRFSWEFNILSFFRRL